MRNSSSSASVVESKKSLTGGQNSNLGLKKNDGPIE